MKACALISLHFTRRTAALLLLTAFVGVFCSFVSLSLLLAKPRARRVLAAALHGARYLDEEGVLRQKTAFDCGPASLAMVAAEKGHPVTEQTLLKTTHTDRRGTTMLNLQQTAETTGLNATSWQLTFSDLQCVPKPVIAFVGTNHFVVVDKATRSSVLVRDPAHGRLIYPAVVFRSYWHGQTIVFEKRSLPCSLLYQASSGNRGGVVGQQP